MTQVVHLLSQKFHLSAAVGGYNVGNLRLSVADKSLSPPCVGCYVAGYRWLHFLKVLR